MTTPTDLTHRLKRIESRLARLERAFGRGTEDARGESAAQDADEEKALGQPASPNKLTAQLAAAARWAVAEEWPSDESEAEPARAARIPPPLPPSAIEPAARASAQTGPAAAPRDIERYIGVAVMGRIGVAAVLLAAGYFAQLAYRNADEWGRVATLYGAGALFLAVGWGLRSRVAARYTALLWGAGSALLWMAAFTAHRRYGVVGPELGFVLLLGASVVGTFHARHLGHRWFAAIALAGAFATPLLVDSASDARTFLLAYVMSLHAWSVLCQAKWGWHGARAVGIVGTIVVLGSWCMRHGAVDASTWLHLNVALLGLVGPELFAAARGRALTYDRGLTAFTLLIGLEGILVGAWLLYSGHSTNQPMPAFGAIVAALACGLAAWRVPHAVDEAGNRLLRGLGIGGGIVAPLGAAILAAWLVRTQGNLAMSYAACAASGIVAWWLMLLDRRSAGGVPGTAFAGVLAMLHVGASGAPVFELSALGALAMLPGAALLFVRPTRGRLEAGTYLGLLAGLTAVVAAANHHPAATFLALGVGLVFIELSARAARTLKVVEAAWAPHLALCAWALLWFFLLGKGELGTALPLLGNAGTLSGAAIVALAIAFSYRRQKSHQAPLPDGIALAPGVLVFLVTLAIGWREASMWAARHMPEHASAVLTGYLALFAVLTTLVGRRVRAPWLAQASGALTVAPAAYALAAAWGTTRTSTPLVELVLAGATPFLLRALGSRRSFSDLWQALAAHAVALAWLLHVAHGRFALVPGPFHARSAAGLVALAAVFATVRVLGTSKRLRAVLVGVSGLPLAYLVFLLEVLHAVADAEPAPRAVAVSLYTTAFAAVLLAIGFKQRMPLLRYVALGTFGLVVAKIGIYDLRTVELPLRILVTGVLGLVLLGAAYAYAQRTRREARGAGSGAMAPAPLE